MRPVRVIIADESPAMRRWYAAALSRVASEVEECENGWQLLNRLADDAPYDLVVASKWLPGLGGAQILAMLRTAEAAAPFILVAPFSGGSVRALVRKVPGAALVEDPLDAVRLAEEAEALLSAWPAERRPDSQRGTARVLRAHARARRASARPGRVGRIA
jgi:DNA-binding NtrC family response regulator